MKLIQAAAIVAAMCVTSSAMANPQILPMKATAKPPKHNAALGPAVPYHGGPILPDLDIVLVQWGPSVDQTQVAYQVGLYEAFATHALPQFNDAQESSLLHFLQEYNTPTQTFSSITYGGNYVIQPVLQPSFQNVLHDNPDFTDYSQYSIAQELSVQMEEGFIPWGTPSTLYVVNFPPGVTIIDRFNTSSCNDWCAYHDWAPHGGTVGSNAPPATQVPFAYVVVPYLLNGGCAPAPMGGCGRTQEEVLGLPASHEIVEAATDPDTLTGWTDLTGVYGEIGDPCIYLTYGDQALGYVDQQPLTGSQYAAQWEWSNVANACADLEYDHICCGFGSQGTCFPSPPGVACSPATSTLGGGTYEASISIVPESNPTLSTNGSGCNRGTWEAGISSPAAGASGTCIRQHSGTYMPGATPGQPYHSQLCLPPLVGSPGPHPVMTCVPSTKRLACMFRLNGTGTGNVWEVDGNGNGLCCTPTPNGFTDSRGDWCVNDIPGLFQ